MNALRSGLILLAVAAAIAACQPAPTGTAITNVTVIDAINGVRENRTVIFEGDEVVAINDATDEIRVATTIDGTDKFLIPGLWDFHVHLSYDDRFAAAMPSTFLSWGITSVRDTGGLMHNMLPIVEAMRADDAIAPRVFFAGPLLDGQYVVYDGDGRPEIGVQNATPDQARETVRQLKEQGVDFIKVYEMVSPAVFEALVETANELDLPIDSHVPLMLRASAAGPSVDSIEHLRNIEMDCASNSAELHETRIELMKNPDGMSGADLRSSLHSLQRLPAIANYDEARCDQTLEALSGTIQVPTLRLVSMSLTPPYLRDDWDDAIARLPRQAREDWGGVTEERRASSAEDVDTTFAEWGLFLTGRAHGKGVPVGAGTDTPIALAIPGYSLHTELEFLVRAGLSPIEALAAATLIPARFFSIEDEMGSIDVGKVADLVLLDASPLDDIGNTKRIAEVISKGRRLDVDTLIQSSREATR